MKKITYLILFMAIVTGCMNEKTQETSMSRKTKVTVTQVTIAGGTTEYGYSGTIEASQTIPLNFRTAGTVEQVYAEAGDFVKKGQVIARLDNTDLQNIYNTMLSKFNQAQDAYDRLKMVYEEGSLPEIKWVEMQTNYDQAKASLELAQNNLDKCDMVAPVSGLVGRRNIEPGQSSITLLSAPIELVSIDKVLVKIGVPENEINKIEKGRKADISVMAAGGAGYQGIVTNISPVAEQMSRTYTVKISVDNPDHLLKPGMVCDVTLASEDSTTLLVVPYQAVSTDTEGRTFVYMVSNDKSSVKKTMVSTGKYIGKMIEITSGLEEGQYVVTGGIEKLSDNSLIEL